MRTEYWLTCLGRESHRESLHRFGWSAASKPVARGMESGRTARPGLWGQIRVDPPPL